MNLLKQHYNSIKFMHKIVECFKTSEIKKGNAKIKYQNYYIDRVIKTLNILIKNNYLNKENYEEEILSLINIKKEQIGYETLIQYGYNSWDEKVDSMRSESYNLGFKYIGDYVYPIIERIGRIESTNLLLVQSENQDYIQSISANTDEYLLNEDIWLLLYAIEFLLSDKQIMQTKYLLISLVSLLGFQESIHMTRHNFKCLNKGALDKVILQLQGDLNDISNLKQLYNICLMWAKLYGFNLEKGRYEQTKWLQSHFNFSGYLKTKENNLDVNFQFDGHLNWDSAKDL